MKFNKVIMGLGVMSLVLTSCDKANEQNYNPAAGVATPPAYFSLDYDSEVVLEENQEAFTIPVYRAEGGAAATVNATVTMTTSANADGLFTLPGDVALNVNTPVNTTFTFEEGATVGTMLVTYPWSEMQNLPGIEFNFDVKVDGEDTPYYLTHTTYGVMYVPWMNPTDELGNDVCYFVDDAIYSGWNLSGNWGTPWKYEVEIQYNPIALEKGQLIFRCMTPYANLGHKGSDEDAFYFTGYDANGDIIPNVMYINATDQHNVYLCDKNGDPLLSIYNTYYTIMDTYGNVGYLDRCANFTAGQPYCVFGGSAYKNSQGDATLNGYMNDEGNKIVFPEGHFFVCMLGDGAALTTSNKLEIWLPGAKAEAEWEELGEAQYTEDVASFLELGESQTYEVPVLQKIKDKNIYKIVNPYTENWPDGNDETEEECDLTIDVTNPNLVCLELSFSGLQLPYGVGSKKYYNNYFINAGELYQYYMQSGSEMTPTEIISEGLNDTFDANSGVINLEHVFVWFVDQDDETVGQPMAMWEKGATGIQIELPSASGAKGYCTSAAGKRGKTVKSAAPKLTPKNLYFDRLRYKIR